jgi:succinate dehydrogenase / fumarate reductase membrane anchor subunit
MVNRIVVGAHYGLKDWLAQRVTACVMAVYTVILLVALLAGGPWNYNSWKALFSQGWMRFATLLFILSLLYHAWVGVRDIWMDYVKNTGLRLALEAATVLWLVGCGGWAVQVIWRS